MNILTGLNVCAYVKYAFMADQARNHSIEIFSQFADRCIFECFDRVHGNTHDFCDFLVLVS